MTGVFLIAAKEHVLRNINQLSGYETGIFFVNYVDALAPCIARVPAIMVLAQ